MYSFINNKIFYEHLFHYLSFAIISCIVFFYHFFLSCYNVFIFLYLKISIFLESWKHAYKSKSEAHFKIWNLKQIKIKCNNLADVFLFVKIASAYNLCSLMWVAFYYKTLSKAAALWKNKNVLSWKYNNF